jgi:hypothetical protein
MAEKAMKIDAPAEMEGWLRGVQARLLSKGVTSDFRIPDDPTDTSKAGVGLIAGAVVGSLTIWANGMIEFIVVNAQTHDDLVARDLEMADPIDLRSALSGLLDEFIEIAAAHREE